MYFQGMNQRWRGSDVDTMNTVSHERYFKMINTTLTQFRIRDGLIRDVRATLAIYSHTQPKGESLLRIAD